MWQTGLAFVLFYFACFVGWCMNIYKMISHLNVIDNLEIARMVGIVFFPLGVILGWFA